MIDTLNLKDAKIAAAQQDQLDADVAAALDASLAAFLSDARRMSLASSRVPSSGLFFDAWSQHTDAPALIKRDLGPATAAYVADALVDSPVVGQAYDSVVSVFTISAAEHYSASRHEQAIREALAMDASQTQVSETALVAGAVPKMIGFGWQYAMQRLARTAVTGLWGTLAIEQMRAEGFQAKRWWTRRDDRVRDTHQAAHSQVRDLDVPFSVGSSFLRWPGDREGDYSETVNCRCLVLAVGNPIRPILSDIIAPAGEEPE